VLLLPVWHKLEAQRDDEGRFAGKSAAGSSFAETWTMEQLGYQSFDTPLFRSQLRAEFSSWIGRHFLKKRSRIRPASTPVLLDLGAGENRTQGWTHVDFFQLPALHFWRRHSGYIRPEVQTDLRFPLDCPSDSIEGVYCSHTLEHLYPKAALALLREVFRVLRSGAWLRIGVPDLEKYVSFYVGPDIPPGFDVFRSGAEAISYVTQNHGHHSAWDERMLSTVLVETGFTSVRRVGFGREGSDRRLIKEEAHREWETLVVEARKP